MAAEASEPNNVARSDRRVECLEIMMSKFGIDSVLIGVPKLARALGMGASTLYAYMRAGTFFVPYRMVNGTPMVKIDDFLDWYLSQERDVRPSAMASNADGKPDAEPLLPPKVSEDREPRTAAAPAKRGRKGSGAQGVKQKEFEPRDVLTKEAADRAVDGIVASVKARMVRQRSPALTGQA